MGAGRVLAGWATFLLIPCSQSLHCGMAAGVLRLVGMIREDPKSLVGLAGTLIGRPALVVGNGESRLTLCLGGLPGDVLVFGCNALYRDFTPDYLGSIDVLMTSEIVRAADGASFVFIGPAGRVRQWEEAEGVLLRLNAESFPSTKPRPHPVT